MATNAEQVVVGANGDVFVGPLDATAPNDVTTSLDSDFLQLGYLSEAGATLSDSKDVVDINAWQSLYPIRRIITARIFTVAFAMRQWNITTLEFAYGGDVAANSGEWTMTPPSPEVIDERSFVLEWQDGDKEYRLYIPRGLVTETVETTLARASAADLPITYTALPVDTSTDLYTLFTNDPAFSAAS